MQPSLVLQDVKMLQFNGVPKKSPSVIIVGAGPAGIAAATKLLENSITNITILEAENRIGGRIHTVKFGDGFVDLGAQYCHGEKGNTVYEMVKNLDLLEHSKVLGPDTIKWYYSNGSAVSPDLAFDFYNSVIAYNGDISPSVNTSLGEAFLEKYNSTILKKYADDKDKLKVATEGIRSIHQEVLLEKGAFSWFQITSKGHHVPCEGDQIMTWKIRGYEIILDILIKSYPDPSKKLPIDDKILLNKKVEKVIWNENTVTVKTSDNSSLTADHVIFTPSIGVLREHKDTLFEPQLPAQKKKALEAIGFDGVMKIILHFPKKWWKVEDGPFFFTWSEEDLLDIKNEFPYGPTKEETSWVAYISALTQLPSNPNVLIAWVAGDLVPEIEKTEKDVLLNGCMYVVRKFLGKDYNVSDADAIVRSQWNINSNFRGTYSYEKVGYTEKDVSYNAKLAEPLINGEGKPTLLFAGEATNPVLYSNVHGAIDSGHREAERIINLYK